MRYAEIDGQGVVFNAHWLTYFDDSCTRFMETLGFGPEFWTIEFDVMLVRAELEWKGSARFDEWIDISVAPVRLGTKSFDLRYEASVDGRAACNATITYVAVQPGANTSIEIPDQSPHRPRVPLHLTRNPPNSCARNPRHAQETLATAVQQERRSVGFGGAAGGADDGSVPAGGVHDFELGRVTVEVDARLDVLAREHRADEAHLDLAVGEKLFAPRVEQHAVGGTRGLHALRDEAGELQIGRQRRVGVEVAAP